MDVFTLKQNRFSVTDTEGNLTYRIDITCSVIRDATSSIKLSPDVFVYSTDNTLVANVTSGGSVDGSFIRVATIADISLLPTSRDDALNTSKTEYRSRVLQLSMPELETAINAIPVVVDRVNALVDAYITYQKNFYTDIDSEYSLPQTLDSSVVSQYTNSYTNAVAARKAAELEQVALTRAYQNIQVKNELLDAYVLELGGYKDVLGPKVTSFADLVTADATLQAVGALVTKKYEFTNLKSLIDALHSNRSSLLTASKAQEAAALSDLKEKEEEVASLQTIEASALSDLAIYCPQLDATQL